MTKLTKEDILACKGLPLAIDVETTGLQYWRDGLIGIGIHCPQAEVSGYIHTCIYQEVPFGKQKKEKIWQGEMDYSKSKRGRRIFTDVFTQPTAIQAFPSQTRINHFLPAIHEICQDPKTLIIGHNLKFDAHFLGLHLWKLPCKILDTAVLSHLIDCNSKKSLAAVEDDFLGTSSKRSHVEKADKRFNKSPWMWGEKVLEDYCINDCVVTFQVAEVMMPIIRKMDLKGMVNLQMKYLRLLQKIEHRGICIDNNFCEKAIIEFEKNLIDLEQDLFDAVGYEFNWRSSKQLSLAIYDHIGVDKPVNPFKDEWGNVRNTPQAKIYTETMTGTPLLVKIKHPLTTTIVDLRETAKLMEYAQDYLENQDNEGAIHASFNITGAVTGRLSCSKPNLQQLAAKFRKYDLESQYTGGSERVGGYNLRESLCARPGYKIVSIDHKQQEARLLAILSEEPSMLQFMQDRKDIHLAIAIHVWGDCGEKENKKHRERSKASVFGLSYGMSIEALQEHFLKHGIEADAEEVEKQLFITFPKLKPWFEETISKIEKNGHIRYWSGRYWFPEYLSEAYKGINAVIQGGAGDFLSVVLIRANQVLEANDWGWPLSIIHDEALFEIKEEFVDVAAPVLAATMEGRDIFNAPFLTDIEVGDSYGTLEPFETDVDIAEINWRDYV